MPMDCKNCGKPVPEAAGRRATHCSARCAKRTYRRNGRARRSGAYVEDVLPPYIFKRDGYRCHLCGRKTLKSKSVPHPRAPIMDHIIPLDLGGTHERANVATACFGCNARKSNSPDGQPMLFG